MSNSIREGGLNFFGQFFSDLGIPVHSRNLASALEKKVKDLRLIPIYPNTVAFDSAAKKYIGKYNGKFPTFCLWYPDSFDDLLVGDQTLRGGYFIFEYNKIPAHFIDSINKIDFICTASAWGVQVLKDNGVTIPCHVVRGGVDHSKFNGGKRKNLDSTYKFLHIGKAESRKGTELLIRSFAKAFQGNKNVTLTLMIDNPHIPNFDAAIYLRSILYPSTIISNILIKNRVKDISEVYGSYDCAVFPSKAEGIGLSIVEAMSSGLPVITSFNSGITEYANDNNCILLKNLVEEEIYDPFFFPRKGEMGTWMSPTEGELIEKLLWVYGNKDKARNIGLAAEKDMKENFTWDQSADSLIEVFDNGNKKG